MINDGFYFLLLVTDCTVDINRSITQIDIIRGRFQMKIQLLTMCRDMGLLLRLRILYSGFLFAFFFFTKEHH